MKHQTVGLQFDFQKSKRAKPWKTALPIVGVPLLAAVLLLALKPARESLKCLCNLVFAASEAVNAYAYDYFEVSDAASPVLALGLLMTAAAGVLLLAYLRGSKIVPLLAALALAGGEIWFGLTPPAAVNVLIFALLGYDVFRSTRKQKVEEPEPELSVDALLAATSDNDDENLEDIGYSEKSETRKLIEKFVDENPDAAALLLRNWLNDDWE